jgi:hypothetical protein
VRGDGSVDGSMSTINPRRGGRERGRSASFDPIHRSLGRICQQRERDREREREARCGGGDEGAGSVEAVA